jgi:hypothetical protein
MTWLPSVWLFPLGSGQYTPRLFCGPCGRAATERQKYLRCVRKSGWQKSAEKNVERELTLQMTVENPGPPNHYPSPLLVILLE